MTSGKQVPLAEVQRRKLQVENAVLKAEKQGWLAEKARLIEALEGTAAQTTAAR
jgi:hypothetical protein